MLALVSAILAVAGCAAPLRTTVRFDSVAGSEVPGERTVASVHRADQVKVFYGKAPDGFALLDAELIVEQGYQHRILGAVKVIRQSGRCTETALARPHVIAQLRLAAYRAGANAVIYAELSERATEAERCKAVASSFGSGWAVILRDPPAKPSAPSREETETALAAR